MQLNSECICAEVEVQIKSKFIPYLRHLQAKWNSVINLLVFGKELKIFWKYFVIRIYSVLNFFILHSKKFFTPTSYKPRKTEIIISLIKDMKPDFEDLS